MIANILGGASAVGIAFVAFTVWPDPAFLEVHKMEVVGDTVFVERSIPEPAGIADWSVVVVDDNGEAPTCQTIHGPELHQGWSRYEASPRQKKSMHLDMWVGDPGCYDRLTPGEYRMYVYWAPRDDRPGASERARFTKQASQ